MKATQELHELGQSLWLDSITRTMLDDGTLERYVDEFSITGLTSNPSIFQKALAKGHAYDVDIAAADRDMPTEALFVEMALADLGRAASLFEPAHERSDGMDGWVSMEVSPLLANDTDGSIEAARRLHEQARHDNVFIKIPGTSAGLKAIEESIYEGIPINVTLLFSRDQYVAAAQAWMTGIERRMEAGLDLRVHSEASLFVSRWDVAVADQVPARLRNRLGVAIAAQTWRACTELIASPRWQKLAKAGAPLQRLLFASTGTKDPTASDVLYVEALAAPDTINTMPEKTLQAFADHGHVKYRLPDEGIECEQVLADYQQAGIDVDALARQLQLEGAEAFVRSWHELLGEIDHKRGGSPTEKAARS